MQIKELHNIENECFNLDIEQCSCNHTQYIMVTSSRFLHKHSQQESMSCLNVAIVYVMNVCWWDYDSSLQLVRMIS